MSKNKIFILLSVIYLVLFSLAPYFMGILSFPFSQSLKITISIMGFATVVLYTAYIIYKNPIQ